MLTRDSVVLPRQAAAGALHPEEDPASPAAPKASCNLGLDHGESAMEERTAGAEAMPSQTVWCELPCQMTWHQLWLMEACSPIDCYFCRVFTKSLWLLLWEMRHHPFSHAEGRRLLRSPGFMARHQWETSWLRGGLLCSPWAGGTRYHRAHCPPVHMQLSCPCSRPSVDKTEKFWKGDPKKMKDLEQMKGDTRNVLHERSPRGE